MKRLVLLGGGHAHVEVLRSLAEGDGGRWDVTMVTPYPWLTYSGMVPGLFAGHYEIDQCTIDLRALAERARATLMPAYAIRVDTTDRAVVCDNGANVAYDVLSLDVGTQPYGHDVRGVDSHAVVMRPLEKAVKGWSDVLVRAREGRVGSVSVVGGGAAGAEVALAMEYRLRQELGLAWAHVRIITNTGLLVPEYPAGARKRLVRKLRRRNIGIHTGSAVTEVGRDYVRLEQGLEFASDAVFWATGGAPQPWIRASGFSTDERGFLLTNDRLQSVSHPDVFGAGDCAAVEGRPHAKAGVFAVRAGPALAANLAAALEGRPLQPHESPARHLALISTGNRHAVGVWDGWSWEGGWVWRWKDRIDRGFVARYGAPGAAR
ncbi:MAG TPA: FAD-dependent oxidoreductase [Usitatibacter sp.]|nr:FAD-dependent oxidoreductase [Usitatibacter sp.]